MEIDKLINICAMVIIPVLSLYFGYKSNKLESKRTSTKDGFDSDEAIDNLRKSNGDLWDTNVDLRKIIIDLHDKIKVSEEKQKECHNLLLDLAEEIKKQPSEKLIVELAKNILNDYGISIDPEEPDGNNNDHKNVTQKRSKRPLPDK